MRGARLLKALETLKDFTGSTGEFIDAFLASSKSNYLALRRYPNLRPSRMADHVQSVSVKEKQRLYHLLYVLGQDGLIAQKRRGRAFGWRLTRRGDDKRKLLAKRLRHALPSRDYPREPASQPVIVIFDVPERERRKRAWLRAALKHLGFRMLQKSVWFGKIKIPNVFLHDLERLRLTSYVEIFTLGKRGTLRHIV